MFLSEGKLLDESDLTLLRAYTLKVEDGITNATFNKFRFAFPQAPLDSIKSTEKRVQFLSGFQPVDDPSGILNPGKTRKNIHTGFFESYNFPKGWGQLPTIIFNTHTVILHLETILTLSTVGGTSLRAL